LKFETRKIKRKRATSLLSEQKKMEKMGNGPGFKGGFALVRRFAEKSPGLGTRLLTERSLVN
jgi:hypothetical protein